MEKKQLPIKQLLILGLIVVAVFLLLDFQARKNQLFLVETQREKIFEEVVNLKQTAAALEDELEFASSDEMVEQFAREDMHAGVQGDVLVVPISPYEVTPTPQPVITPSPQAFSNWDVWMALLFASQDEE